jgi:chromosome segregation ATPase
LTVTNISDENQRLRNHLSALLAQQRQALPIVQPQTETSNGVDYANLARLQAELQAAKVVLLEKEANLDAKGSDPLRKQLIASNETLNALQAEVKSLYAVVEHLRLERETLARQNEMVLREIEGRRAVRDAVDDVGSGRSVGVERALLDVRGVVDAVVKSWGQVSSLSA